MAKLQKIKCLECGKEFERDLDDPKVKKMFEQMGSLADQCEDCLRKWAKEETES